MVLLVLAAIYAVRKHKQHKADQARLETYESAIANLDLNAGDALTRDIAYLQQQAIDASTSRAAARGCCGRASRDYTTCGRLNASACHQRKCARRQQGGGFCVGKRQARTARAAAAAAVRGVEIATVDVQEQGITDLDAEKHAAPHETASYGAGDNKGAFKATEKEVEINNYGRESQVLTHSTLPPYKG